MAALFDQFAKGLGVGIHVLKQFMARGLPGSEPAVELANVGVAQRPQAIDSHRGEAFAVVIHNDLHVLAWQPRLGFERDPIGGHVGGEQRMAGGKDRLMPDIEQSDFIAPQQRDADVGGRDSGQGHDGQSGLRVRALASKAR